MLWATPKHFKTKATVDLQVADLLHVPTACCHGRGQTVGHLPHPGFFERMHVRRCAKTGHVFQYANNLVIFLCILCACVTVPLAFRLRHSSHGKRYGDEVECWLGNDPCRHSSQPFVEFSSPLICPTLGNAKKSATENGSRRK